MARNGPPRIIKIWIRKYQLHHHHHHHHHHHPRILPESPAYNIHGTRTIIFGSNSMSKIWFHSKALGVLGVNPWIARASDFETLGVSVSFELPMIPLDWSNWKIWLPFGDQTGRQLLTVAPLPCPPHQLLSIWPRRPRVWKVFGPWFQQSHWELAYQSDKPRKKAKNFSSWAFFWKVWQQHVGTVVDAVQVHRLPSGRQQKLDYLQWEVPESYCQELKINQQLHEQAAKTETKAEKIARDSDPLNFSLQLFNLCWPKALGVSLLHKAQTGEFTLNRHPLFLSHKLYQDRIRRANSVPPPRKRCFRNWWDTMMTEKVHAHSRNEKGLLTGCWTIIADHRCPIKGTSTTTTKRPQLPPTTSN